MIFTTYWFVIAMALFLPLYFLIQRPVPRKFLLLAFCIVFHGHFAGSAGVIPILINGFIVYFCGRSQKPWALKLGIALSVGSLVWYKYTGFFATQVFGLINEPMGLAAAAWAKSTMPPTPPLAISFFAFEFVHYLFDVLKGRAPIRSLTNFWCFTLFFPSLVAGPIKRYEQFLPALDAGLAKSDIEDVSAGVSRIAIGYVKKVLIADNLTNYIDAQYPQFANLSILDRWIFVVLISLRILMDFSGYSDIAIGSARLMGIGLPENFNW